MEFMIDDHVRKFRGTVSVLSADNPASQAIGGFKNSSNGFSKMLYMSWNRWRHSNKSSWLIISNLNAVALL